MSNKPDKLMYVREFLNPPESGGTAFVHAWVSTNHGRWGPDCELEIADCNRTISLDFYASDDKSRQNRLYKIDKLIETLLEFRKQLKKAYKEQAKYEKENPRKDDDDRPDEIVGVVTAGDIREALNS